MTTNDSPLPIASTMLAILLTLLLAGCGQQPQRPGGDTDAGLDDMSAQRSKTIVVALQSDGKTLDPHKATDAASMRLIENMYSTLFRYTPTYGEVEPNLVREYEWNDDHTQLSILLRNDVKFHDELRPLTTADVKFSIERIKSEGVRKEQFQAIDQIEVHNDMEFTLHLTEPLAPLITYLAHPMNAIVDKQVVEANDGQIDRIDAGSGPFKLDSWKRDLHCKLISFDNYFLKDKPFLNAIVYRPIADSSSRQAALRNGEVDMILDVTVKNQQVLANDDAIRLESVPGTFWEYVGMNTKRPPLDQPEVRQAIAWALNRSDLNKLVKFGEATILDGGHIPPGHWAHAEDLVVYPRQDMEKARQLLTEAGLGDGFEVTMKVGSDFPYQVQAAQIVKQQLRDLGIEVKVQNLESSVFFDALGNQDFDLTVVGWLGFVDPDEWTYNLFHSGAKWNQQSYSNPEVDELLEQGRRTLERTERQRIYRQVQDLVTRDAPMAFLYVNPRTAAMGPRVKDFVVHPTVTSIFLRETHMEPK